MASSATPSLSNLPVEAIGCAPQVRERFDDESLAGLAQSLVQVGLQQPIRVRRVDGGWVVVDGERRLRAAKLAGWKEIPAVIEDRELSEGEVIQRQLVANCQREDLTPIERAQAIRKLMQTEEWTAATAACKLGMSPATVSKLLTLLSLPDELRERIHAGEIAASTAYELAKVREPEARAALMEEACAGKLTRDRAAKAAQERSGPAPRPRARKTVLPPLKRVALPLGERRSLTVSAPELSLAELVAWLETLVPRLRGWANEGWQLADIKKALAEAPGTESS